MNKPTYDELFQLLDDVSAAAATLQMRYGWQLPDTEARGGLIRRVRKICDGYLRGPEREMVEEAAYRAAEYIENNSDFVLGEMEREALAQIIRKILVGSQ